MKISKELRERIRQLEQEQQKQSKELEQLGDLRDMVAIAELEQELAGIAVDTPKRVAGQETHDVDLSREGVAIAQAAKGVKVKGPDSKTDKDIDLSREALGRGKKPVTARAGFVVCLLFNETAPSEWAEEAGGGWRGKGLGTAYPDKASAQRTYIELKTKWPDYPIEIRPI